MLGLDAAGVAPTETTETSATENRLSYEDKPVGKGAPRKPYTAWDYGDNVIEIRSVGLMECYEGQWHLLTTGEVYWSNDRDPSDEDKRVRIPYEMAVNLVWNRTHADRPDVTRRELKRLTCEAMGHMLSAAKWESDEQISDGEVI